jgi:hypothetical protein
VITNKSTLSALGRAEVGGFLGHGSPCVEELGIRPTTVISISARPSCGACRFRTRCHVRVRLRLVGYKMFSS